MLKRGLRRASPIIFGTISGCSRNETRLERYARCLNNQAQPAVITARTAPESISASSDISSKKPSTLPNVDAGLDKLLHKVVQNRSLNASRLRHPETENDGLRLNLLGLPKYSPLFNPVSMRVSLPASEMVPLRERLLSIDPASPLQTLVDVLRDVSLLASVARGRLIEDYAFTTFVQLLQQKLQSSEEASFPQLHTMLQAFQSFHFEQLAHNHETSNILRNILDRKCMEALPMLTNHEAFILLDLWYLSSCSRLAHFPSFFLSKIKPSLTSMEPEEIVRLLFAVMLQRSADAGLMLTIERLILPHLSTFTASELAVICAGFFKTQTSPGSDLVDKLSNRLLALDGIVLQNDYNVTMYAKFLSRYAMPSLHDKIQKLLLKIKPHTENLSVTSCGHLGSLLETTLQADEDFLQRVAEKLLSKWPDVRLKDMAKITKTCAFLNFRPEFKGVDFFEIVKESAEKLLDVDTISTFPSKLVELLAALAQMNVFSTHLLGYLEKPVFFRNYSSQAKSLLADDDLLKLHYAVQLDFPDYELPVVPEKLLESTLRNKEMRDGPLNTAVASMQKGLETLLQDSDKHASKKSVAVLSPLPYAESVLVVRLKDFSPIPLPPDLITSKQRHLLRKPPSDHTCSVILYHPWWSYSSPLHKATGYREMKIRHLQALGYNVINVNQIDTQNLTFVQKIKMLRDRLFFEKYDTRASVIAPEKPGNILTSTVNFSASSERKVSIRDFV
ncbi:hypothetical protein RvY_00549 [Ramazzottius varieornatus]|uniref:RAP domain-containing protein n=1 Tax=Ramazzottius varieornatus TaxID=947166 RepID=A0A1D1UD59_RAMVA|nr:hypothetical protein RvY_00549 [Ramazzottius varieornatus]